MSIQISNRTTPPLHVASSAQRGTRLEVYSQALQTYRRTLIALFIAIMGVLYLVQTVQRASGRLWYDELFTLYISQQPSLEGMWQALASGLDQHPPLYFILTRAGWSLTGSAELGMRLPSIAGFLLMSVCLFCFVRHHWGAIAGLISVVFTWLTPAYDYATEARPYGVILGCAALALFSWHQSTEGRHRLFYLPLLTLSITVALLCHCYAILLFVPLGLGELVRTLRRRKIDWLMVLAMASGAPAVLVYIPILQASRQLLTYRPWSEPVWIRPINFYKDVIDPTMIPLTVALFAVGAVFMIFGRRMFEPSVPTDNRPPMPLHETVAVVTLAALPIVGVLLGKLFTGVLELRYVFPFVLGYAILLGAFAGACERFSTLRTALLTFFTCWFLAGSLGPSSRAQRSKTAFDTIPQELMEGVEQTQLPIVMVNPFLYLELSHYGPAEIKDRMVYLVDAAVAVQYGETDVFDRGLPIVKRWVEEARKVTPLEEFLQKNKQFLIYGEFEKPIATWIMPKLLDDNVQIRLKKIRRQAGLWEAVVN